MKKLTVILVTTLGTQLLFCSEKKPGPEFSVVLPKDIMREIANLAARGPLHKSMQVFQALKLTSKNINNILSQEIDSFPSLYGIINFVKFHEAAKKGDLEFIENYIKNWKKAGERFADIFLTWSPEGDTIFHTAAKAKQWKVLEKLAKEYVSYLNENKTELVFKLKQNIIDENVQALRENLKRFHPLELTFPLFLFNSKNEMLSRYLEGLPKLKIILTPSWRTHFAISPKIVPVLIEAGLPSRYGKKPA